MSGETDIRVIIPALNEESAIEKTVLGTIRAGQESGRRLEMILVNDGSRDRTGEIMDRLAQEHHNIQVVHHDTPQGLARAFRIGIERLGTPRYLCLIPGDNAFAEEGIKRLFEATTKADFITSFRTNQFETRTLLRFLLSMLFTLVVSILFGGRIKDYHSMNLYPLERLRQLDLRATSSGAYQLEAVIRLLRLNLTIYQVPVVLTPQPLSRSTSLNLRTLNALVRIAIDLTLRR
jgi:glycosyltransferase involved in cell wall biosynthesis